MPKNKLDYLAEALAEFGLSTASQVPATAYGAYKGATTSGGLSTRLRAFQRGAEDLSYQPRGAAAQDLYGTIAEHTPEVLSQGLQRYGEWSAENPTLGLVADAALGTIGGATGKALKREIFRGPRAGNADEMKAADAAFDRIKAGEDPAAVWQETGWGRHPKTGQRITEVDDSGAKMVARPGTKNPMQLEQVIEHPELFKVTPGARLTDVISEGDRGGTFYSGLDKIGIGGKLNPSDFMDTMVHELDHRTAKEFRLPKGGSPSQFGYDAHQTKYDTKADELSAQLKVLRASNILTGDQLKEIAAKMTDFAHGREGSVSDVMDLLPRATPTSMKTRLYSNLMDYAKANADRNEAYDKYRNISGEAMARLTTKRRNLSASERREDYPFDPNYFKRLTGSRIEDLTDPPSGGGIQ